jgi:hypothetical protein
MHAQPAKANTPRDQRQHNQDVRPERAEIGVGAEHQEDDNLNGEADAVAEQNHGIDGAVGAGEAHE